MGGSESPAERLSPRALVALAVLLCAGPALAGQDPPATVTATASNVTRVESWSYFEPAPDPRALTQGAPADPRYTFIGNRSDLGVRVDGARAGIAGAFTYVRLENLPTNAIGPGGLGAGAFYFAAVGLRYSYQLWVSELVVRARTRDGGVAASFGRMRFASGGEVVSPHPALERLKRERLQARLVGEFDGSLYERRFDGIRVDVDRARWRVTSTAFLPTQGGYEESTNLSMPKVQIAGVAWTGKAAAPREWQVFAHVYRDRRALAAVVDNTRSPDRPVDVTVAAAGGSHARVAPVRTGEVDTLVWAAAEWGDWYGQPHRAASVAVEAGHRWTRARTAPWVRAGYLYASGDDDPRDNRHGTFFQMLPSSRKYARSSVYAQMNVHDVFVQVVAEPGRLKTRLDLHRVSLASGADLWYQGSGATASTGRFFGFAGREARGATRLGTVIEGSVEAPIAAHWLVRGYAGAMWGGAVVRGLFAGTRLTTWHLENVIRF